MDRLVCNIRDCFNTERKWRKFFPEDVGYPVFVSNGSKAHLCYQRRESDVATKAFVDASKVISILRQLNEHILTQRAEAQFFDNNSLSIDTSSLWSFEKESSTTSLDASTSAWASLLQTVPACSGIDSTDLISKIKQYLERDAGRGARKDNPHSDSIWNADEILRTLEESNDADLIQLFRKDF